MRAEQHDATLGPCPWCSSEENRVYDEGSDDDRSEPWFWAQCAECNQCSPSYPTIEALRAGWAECRRGAGASVWVGPFANTEQVYATAEDYFAAHAAARENPELFAPREIRIEGENT